VQYTYTLTCTFTHITQDIWIEFEVGQGAGGELLHIEDEWWWMEWGWRKFQSQVFFFVFFCFDVVVDEVGMEKIPVSGVFIYLLIFCFDVVVDGVSMEKIPVSGVFF
jgi:hypothetical protein